MIITANEVKNKGVSIFNDALKHSDEAIINVRGKNKFVVMDIDKYDEIVSHNIDIAYLQTKSNITNGNYKTQSAKQHLQDLRDAL
jgi:prevent-host-death family protein